MTPLSKRYLNGTKFSGHRLDISALERGGLDMIMAVMELVPQNDKRLALLEILRFVEEHVQGKAGCLGCGVYEAVDGTQRILYVERWGSTKDLRAHIRSELYFPILSAMELADEKPRISF